MNRTAMLKGFALILLLAGGVALIREIPAGPGQREYGPVALVTADSTAVGLRIELDINEDERLDWEGEVQLSSGSLLYLDLWESGQGSQVEGQSFRSTARPRRRRAEPAPRLLFLTLSGSPQTVVELVTNHGSAEFAVSEVPVDRPLPLLDGKIRISEAPAAFALRRPGEDDFPAAAPAPDGSLWTVYVSYQRGQPLDQQAIENQQFDSLVPTNNGDRLFLMRYDGSKFSSPLEVTQGLGDVWHPAVACDGSGKVWVTWSQQQNGNWDLYQRRWNPQSGQWTPVEQLTTDPGADINVVSTRDAQGNVWWAWQGWRSDNFDIFVAASTGRAVQKIADSPANDWNPSMAADSKGSVYVGWDSYASGDYDVLVRRLGEKGNGPIAVAGTALFEARASLACDSQDRLWIAYEEDDPNWGKDYATSGPNRPVENLGAPLYLNRHIRVKCLVGDGLMVPEASLARAYGDEDLPRPKSFPRLLADGEGNLWLFFRHHVRASGAGTDWAGYVTYYDGSTWAPAQLLPASDYLMDNRPALASWKDQGILALYSSDARVRGGNAETDNDLFAAILDIPGQAEEAKLVLDTSARLEAPAIHPNEPESIARLRQYRLELGGKSYRLLRGEFHRHTEYTSHRDQDGSLEDMWRYGLDAGGLDWIGNGDHDNGAHRQYSWWVIQKMTDIFHHPPHFVPPFTYERSVRYPNGHRNVMLARRGIRPLPRAGLPGTAEEGTPDTKLLYAYLRRFAGICAIHTSGTNMGTDWRDNDPEVEPIVEIYQGHRHNYEHFGAPRSATSDTQIGGYQPAGFVWNALARGYRLGFQSSSDHVSTHMSYAVAIAEEATRESLLEAFRRRHCYAATDNILLDVRSGDHLMGDEFSSDKPVRLEIKAAGTRPIRRIDVIKDNGYAYTLEPRENEVEFTWQDLNQPASAVSYYYVRVEQEDGQLAWSSPLWVRYE